MATEVSEYQLADDFMRRPPGLPFAESHRAEDEPVKPRVLIVDDERLLADTTAAILRSAGFRTETAYEGWVALEIVASFRPDYVLTDVMMPLMNGVELAIAITKMLPEARVVLFSGQAGISDIIEDGHSRGYDFPILAKPVHPLRLIETLKGNS